MQIEFGQRRFETPPGKPDWNSVVALYKEIYKTDQASIADVISWALKVGLLRDAN